MDRCFQGENARAVAAVLSRSEAGRFAVVSELSVALDLRDRSACLGEGASVKDKALVAYFGSGLAGKSNYIGTMLDAWAPLGPLVTSKDTF